MDETDRMATAHRERTERALVASLETAGVFVHYRRAVAALLMERHTFQFAEAGGNDLYYAASADTPFGPRYIGEVVGEFLDSDEGKAFNPKRGPQSDGRFTLAIAGMARN